jgi:hypothetical protein
MKRIWPYIFLIIVTLFSSACGVLSVESSAQTTAMISPPTVRQSEHENTLLLWEGPALFAEDQTECHRLRVTQNYQAFVGLCNGEQTEVEFVTNREGGLADMVSRFAMFQSDMPDGRIIFNGRGEVDGPAWERAIINWAQFTYTELVSGRVGAANRTVLAWNLGEPSGQSGQCQMLIVLAHGYATAGLAPCEGGQMQVLASGWVDTTDWEQFDTWLSGNAPFYRDNSYLNGQGTTEMSVDEANELAEWAETMYAKLTQTGSISNDMLVALNLRQLFVQHFILTPILLKSTTRHQ